LLFVQILYRQQFYSANLLLGWRWMVVIPVLVIAFYLLYVVKSKAISQWPIVVRLGLSVGISACFLFVAFCWTANHLLSLNATEWPEAYETGRAVKSPSALLLRLLTWVAGTFPAMSILAAWQLRGLRAHASFWDASVTDSDWTILFRREHRRLAVVSIAGLIVAFMTAIGYWMTLNPADRTVISGSAGLPWVLIVIGAGLFQIVGWGLQFRRPCLCVRWLSANTAAMTTTLVATAALREILRLSQASLEQVNAATKAAASVGGFGLFLVFTVLNAGLIAWCIRMVQSGQKKST
jgi:hypothetical protein